MRSYRAAAEAEKEEEVEEEDWVGWDEAQAHFLVKWQTPIDMRRPGIAQPVDGLPPPLPSACSSCCVLAHSFVRLLLAVDDDDEEDEEAEAEAEAVDEEADDAVDTEDEEPAAPPFGGHDCCRG